jgi:alkylation response protein AidB-like acyl-CoA dehydrogenase
MAGRTAAARRVRTDRAERRIGSAPHRWRRRLHDQRLNQFISNGSHAVWYVVFGKTDPAAGHK